MYVLSFGIFLPSLFFYLFLTTDPSRFVVDAGLAKLINAICHVLKMSSADHRNTHSFVACCSTFFWQLQSPHHTTSTARFWQKNASQALKRHAGAPKRSPRTAAARRRQGRAAVESGCHRPNIERMVRPSCFGGSIERMVYDVYHSGSCMIQRGSRAVAILQNHSLIPFKFETRMTPGRARTAAPLGNSRTRAGAASSP